MYSYMVIAPPVLQRPLSGVEANTLQCVKGDSVCKNAEEDTYFCDVVGCEQRVDGQGWAIHGLEDCFRWQPSVPDDGVCNSTFAHSFHGVETGVVGGHGYPALEPSAFLGRSHLQHILVFLPDDSSDESS